MSDVLDIARKKREQLQAEVSALDAFIRMGEKIADEGDAPKSHRRPSQIMSRQLDALRVTAAE